MTLWRIASILTWAPVAVVVNDRLGTLHTTRTSEMAPAVPAHTLCVIRRIHRLATLTHGEVVAVTPPDGSKTLLRRLVAIPGDYVKPRDDAPMQFVPPGFVWVEPDSPASPSAPCDSHALCEGSIPVALVLGRVSRMLPSCNTLEVVPSDRAFPSNNHQLYVSPQPSPG